MVIQVGWYLENHVTYVKIMGDFQEKTFLEAMSYRTELVNITPTNTVHNLMDVNDTETNLEISAYNKLYIPPNNGWTVAIGQQRPIAKFIAGVILKLLKQELKNADSLAEGIAFLKSVDEDIHDQLDSGEIVILREFHEEHERENQSG